MQKYFCCACESKLIRTDSRLFFKLFNTADWPARWYCGNWTDFNGWLYILSDLMIWASYFAIPLLLFRIVRERTDLPFIKIFWLFIAFILLCGSTHFIDTVIFWCPAYRLSGFVRFINWYSFHYYRCSALSGMADDS
jgi:chemotaxis family two-component system sensor kinase Cph1